MITQEKVRKALRERTVEIDLDELERQLLIMERDMQLTPDEARTLLLGAAAVLKHSNIVSEHCGSDTVPPIWMVCLMSGRPLRSISKVAGEVFLEENK